MADVKIGSLIIVHFVEQQLQGWTFKRDHWPLHITLVPWFTINDEEAVIRSLERIALESEPIRVGVGPEDYFGIRNNIPVNVIVNQRPVRAFHEKLLATLPEADIAFHEQRYMGKEYTAHITRHRLDDRHSNDGEEVLINNFFLVRLIDEHTCRVEDEFILTKT